MAPLIKIKGQTGTKPNRQLRLRKKSLLTLVIGGHCLMSRLDRLKELNC